MTSKINIDEYIINDIEKLENLRNELGIKTWEQFAVLVDCSPSNIFDHVYYKKEKVDGKVVKPKDGELPIYEKLLQVWHLKLFTLINYLLKTGQNDELEAALTPIALPKKMPDTVALSSEDLFENRIGTPVNNGSKLAKLTKEISEYMDLEDPTLRRGPTKRGQIKPSKEEQLPLTAFMSSLAGIAMRTYISYLKAPDPETIEDPKKRRNMRSIVVKLYSIASYLLEENRKDLLELIVSIDESYMTDYGVKRIR
ncbi:hypothetical protein L1267_10805 [Pseudoalteromonas sp. OFAV1]|jgi:hypothetical protein|uniref:hypothetical protein n=1 Tax=Pseudoalteromonas sp. OFAV1 TaxID=2908892 RepID=UPI001F1FCFB8|nr:hypothetical protein [Pseudoalteromonas sp. OFAV1]MCF2900892.1 hypothetical protein [Pseudoalteromonas sp. OFAV1]